MIGSHDLRASNAGVAGGVDYRLAPNSLLEVAISGSSLSYHLNSGLGSGKGDAVQAGVYGSTRLDKAYVSAAAAFGWFDLSTDRTVLLPGVTDHLTAGFSARSIGGRIEAGYRVPVLASSGVTPYGALQAQTFRTPFYAERDVTGLAGFALNYNAETTSDVRGELGARFDSRRTFGNGALLILRGRAAWTYEFDRDRAITSAFQVLPTASFAAFGATPARDAALVSAGGELRLANRLSVLAKLDGEFAGKTQVYAGNGTLRYTW